MEKNNIDFRYVNTTAKIYDDCENVYNEKGMSGVIDFVNEMKSNNKPYSDLIVDEKCEQCDAIVPSLNHTCLCCGNTTAKDTYFKILSQGWNGELQREEIQIHCGENGNLFLIKTDEGFIVDVYNQNENIDSMTIWEDELIDEDYVDMDGLTEE